MKYPKIGDMITEKRALKLCSHYKLDYLVERIKQDPKKYRNWEFDGISGVWDELAAKVTGVNMNKLVYLCALPHDLAYAYGDPGNEEERKKVDKKFKKNLIKQAKMNPFWAEIFYRAVRIGGREAYGLSFSWAFAQDKSRIEIII